MPREDAPNDRSLPIPADGSSSDAGPGETLTRAERQDIVQRFQNLPGRQHDFVSEIARQATDARGRVDDDVYGIIQATIEALAFTGGQPPPILFAVTHYETGDVRQVGFTPPGVDRIGPGGRFITNDPRFRQGNLPRNVTRALRGRRPRGGGDDAGR